jgi:anaerobic C4-dicarboxylate transporter
MSSGAQQAVVAFHLTIAVIMTMTAKTNLMRSVFALILMTIACTTIVTLMIISCSTKTLESDDTSSDGKTYVRGTFVSYS